MTDSDIHWTNKKERSRMLKRVALNVFLQSRPLILTGAVHGDVLDSSGTVESDFETLPKQKSPASRGALMVQLTPTTTHSPQLSPTETVLPTH